MHMLEQHVRGVVEELDEKTPHINLFGGTGLTHPTLLMFAVRSPRASLAPRVFKSSGWAGDDRDVVGLIQLRGTKLNHYME